jgi:L-iditol 2-dehydrogenase
VPVHECVGEVVESTSDSICPGEHVVAIPEGDQGLAEFFIAQSAKGFRLPDQLLGSRLSPLVQPLATVLYGADKVGDVSGRTVAIIGLGPIGQLMCWVFKKRGANILFGVDPCLERCLAAERIGATQSFAMRSSELLHRVRSDSLPWDAPDICIEAVGHQTSTINECIGLARPDGTILAMGVPDQAIYPLDYQLLFRQNLHLIASVTPDWRIYLPAASNLLCSHLEDLEFLVTHRFPIREVQEAYHLYEQQGASLKVLLDASEW